MQINWNFCLLIQIEGKQVLFLLLTLGHLLVKENTIVSGLEQSQ